MKSFILLTVLLLGCFLDFTSGQQPIGGNCDKTNAELICGKYTECINAVCTCRFNYRPGKESDIDVIFPPKPNIDCIDIKCRNNTMCTEYFANTVCDATFGSCDCDKGYERAREPGCRRPDNSWIWFIIAPLGLLGGLGLLFVPLFFWIARRQKTQAPSRIVAVGVVAFVAEENPPQASDPPPRYTQ